MNAILCNSFGLDNLVYQPINVKEPRPEEIQIEAKAIGVNYPDLLMIENKYQFKPTMPFIPGAEIAGIVRKVGSKVENFIKGDRIIAIDTHGAYSQLCNMPAQNCFHLDKSIPFESGAVLQYTYGTAFHALIDRAKIEQGDKIAVLGAGGGIGLASIDIAKNYNCEIWAAASSETKLRLAKKAGANGLINYSKEDLKIALKETGNPFDLVLDPVGGENSEKALRCLNWNGKLMVVGFTSGKIPKIPSNLVLLKSCQVMGVFWSAFRKKFHEKFRKNSEELLSMMKEGKLSPIIDQKVPLKDAKKVLKSIKNRESKGKTVLIP